MVRFSDCLMVTARHPGDLRERCVPAGSSGPEERLSPVLGAAWVPFDHPGIADLETMGGTVPGAVGVVGTNDALRSPVFDPGRGRAGDAGGGSGDGAGLAVPSRRRLRAEMASPTLSVRITRAGRCRGSRRRGSARRRYGRRRRRCSCDRRRAGCGGGRLRVRRRGGRVAGRGPRGPRARRGDWALAAAGAAGRAGGRRPPPPRARAEEAEGVREAASRRMDDEIDGAAPARAAPVPRRWSKNRAR